MSTPQVQAAVGYLQEQFQVSQRRAATVLGRARSTVRYRRRRRDGEAELVKALRRLARRHPRFGYKKIHACLRRDGWRVNRKRVRRLWNELGLRRRKPRKKPRKGVFSGTSANSCVNQPARCQNDVWTYDFVADRLADGTTLKWLTLVDEYTRECLTIYVSQRVTGVEVRRVLAQVIGRRGTPQRIRSDNGAEFVCAALRSWQAQVGMEPLLVAPGSPWENGYIESFNACFRDEFLNGSEFETVAEAKSDGAAWRREYNEIRPHGSLDYQTPREFAAACGPDGRHRPTKGQSKQNNG